MYYIRYPSGDIGYIHEYMLPWKAQHFILAMLPIDTILSIREKIVRAAILSIILLQLVGLVLNLIVILYAICCRSRVLLRCYSCHWWMWWYCYCLYQYHFMLLSHSQKNGCLVIAREENILCQVNTVKKEVCIAHQTGCAKAVSQITPLQHTTLKGLKNAITPFLVW